MERQNALYAQLKIPGKHERLLPDNYTLRALVLLHQRFDANDSGFQEDDIRTALTQAEEDTSSRSIKERKRESWAPHSRVIHQLQAHILTVSPRERTFRFTSYGRRLLLNISEELSDKVDTAGLAYAFRNLLLTLQAGNVESFELWEANELSGKRQDIEKPLRTLDDNIRKTLRRLKDVSREDEAFLDTVRQVDETLDTLRYQAQEISQAFSQVDDLTDYIDQLWQNPPLEPEAAATFLTSVERAKQVLYAAKRQLGRVRERLEKAQPRVRELFGNLRKLHFDRKSEEFLRQLLYAEHKGKPTSEVYLAAGVAPKPAGLGPLCFGGLRTHKQLFPVERTTSPPRSIAPERVEALRQYAQDQVLISEQVAACLAVIERALAETSEVDFAPIAADMVRAHHAWAYPILARLLARLIRHEARVRGWHLHIDQEEINLAETVTDDVTHALSLWSLRISRPKTLQLS